ncbi:hypothetical protein L0F63_003323 [Massospora cicadina]|nr:hypothetical protein L0F63_003323 [Massospora cicadina]
MDDDGYAQIEEEVWFGRVPSLEKFVKVIETRIEKKKTDRIQEVISLMWELQIPFNAEIYHNIISKLLESGDTQCIITFLESISKHNNNEGFLTSHWLFRLAVKDGDMIIAKQCFSLMFRHGYVRKNETHAEFLKCVGTGNFQMLSDCLNLRQMLLLLKEFARRESVDEILALFSLTAELGLILDTACYDVALEVLIRRAPAMGMRLFLAMKKNSLTPPSSQTYLIVIRGLLLRNNHFEGAAAIRERIPSTCATRGSTKRLITTYWRPALSMVLEVALSFFRNLLDRKEVNLRTFYILTAYIVEKDHIRPRQIHNRRLQAGIRPDVFTYSIFITYFANVAKDIARGVHWVEMQVAAGITPIGKPIGDLLILIKRSKDIASIRKMQVLLRRSNFLPNLDDHIERYIHNVLNGHEAASQY